MKKEEVTETQVRRMNTVLSVLSGLLMIGIGILQLFHS